MALLCSVIRPYCRCVYVFAEGRVAFVHVWTYCANSSEMNGVGITCASVYGCVIDLTYIIMCFITVLLKGWFALLSIMFIALRPCETN